MPITTAEIRPGIVAYLSATALNADITVQQPVNPTTRNGPFLCFAVNGDQTGWAPITGQHRVDRLEILAHWRTGGTPAWLQTDQYLNDGDTTYVGSKASFVAASQATDTLTMANRPKVTRQGVAAVLAEVRAKGGLVP
jgi:hypothetical protein